MTFSRVRALIVVAVLFVVAGIIVIAAINKDSQTNPHAVDECPAGMIPAHTRMPERNQVTVNVFNSTKTVGLALQVGDLFKFRGFNVHNIGDTKGKALDDIAVISYGPEAVGAAYLVSANFLVDEATMQFDIERKGPEVDVTIGTQFQQLATTTEVNQSIAAIGNPALPPGTCNAPGN